MAKNRGREEKSLAAMEHFLKCHVCSETFRDPVSLSCHHSFCSSCLNTFWDQTKSKNCPVCKRKSSKDVSIHFPLKVLADSFAGREEAGSSEERREEGLEVEVVCSEHTEEPKWFCEVEQRAVCHICEFPAHHNHKVVRLEQAVNDLKEKLKSDLKSLQDKQHKYKDVAETYKKVVQHSKKLLGATERQIRVEFEKLHRFLREEEKAKLAALREEEEEKGKTISKEMKIIQDQISSLTASISTVKQDLQKQKVSFLTSYKHTQTSARAQVTLPDPQLVSGALIDVCKHLGNLTFRVWEKMKGVVKFTPVILDLMTAHPLLSLSDDLTSGRHREIMQQLPDNPERFTRYSTVLGSEGFSSGKHSWEVEVEDHPEWTIGVARESVDRKGERDTSPEDGIWCIWMGRGGYISVLGETLRLKRKPQRIRVQLDCDKGEVSFYDPEDMSHIYTHKDMSVDMIFTEKLYPFFSIEKAGDAKHPDVKILQSELTVSVMSS